MEVFLSPVLSFLWWYRKASQPGKHYYARFRLKIIREKYGLDVSRAVKIGKGLFITHPYCIAINDRAVLGDNINITKGVTIGQENRGKRKGAPTLGNRIWIGANATIVGNIHIGDDVMIVSNSYVNQDVPSHSIVIGNPCKIIARENATEEYVNWLV